MIEKYLTLKSNSEAEIIIEKSKFLAYSYPVDCVEDVSERLKDLKKTHPFATHICYGYVLGEASDIIKFSDDGEPKGTAGLPILDCIRKKNLTNIFATVIRYFGGVKLGAGGLVRAYSQAASAVLKQENICEAVYVETAEVVLSFEAASKIREIKNAVEAGREYGESVAVKFFVRPALKEAFISELCERLQSRPEIRWGKPLYTFFDI